MLNGLKKSGLTLVPNKRYDIQLSEPLKKSVFCYLSFSFRQLSVLKNDKILAFLTEVKKVSSTLPYYKMSFWFGFPTLRICFKIIWVWFCDSADNIKYVTVSNRKVIEVGKSKNILFFIQRWFGPLFCEKVIFYSISA